MAESSRLANGECAGAVIARRRRGLGVSGEQSVHGHTDALHSL
jgi:hypothetical protein